MSGVSWLYLYYYVVIRIGRVVGLPSHTGVVGYYLIGLYHQRSCYLDVHVFFAVTQVGLSVAHFDKLCRGQLVIRIDGAVDVTAVLDGIAVRIQYRCSGGVQLGSGHLQGHL